MTGTFFDWHYLWDATPLLLTGLRLTVVLACACIAASIAIGYIGVTILFLEVPVLRRLVRGYIALFRSTPLLVQIFFFYFGLPEIGVRVDALTSGIIVLSLWGGAYQLENLRGAVDSLPRRLIEAARSLGLHPLRTYCFIILPVATRTVVPAMMNTAVSTTKNSALLTAIGVPELTYVAMDNIANSARGLENFFALFVGYLIIVAVMSCMSSLVEARLGRGFAR
ncbi:glutamine ABC transporter permease [Caballeronia pedi]|uniref:Glutamine ABC transporter permease n=1 Tax=Caballeronia pedi TaxID=1777141 RepID=A0A158DRU3_9BURK|nr:amino acid ABC transporter permease [Caballeronia pedi]SAK97295.1 glutamine ABC transporter permease [Caballeronia pedi]